jgi:CubicO group peptidase (beta-lactamase class C family)
MEAVARVLHNEVAAGRTPAVQYRFVTPDSVLFRHDEGIADITTGTPVSSATAYNGYSITKTFTALAVLRLAERGSLQLDGLAADYLPGFPYSRQITIRHLLAHAAGIPNPIPISWIHLESEHAAFKRDEFFKTVFARHPKVQSAPNTRFRYTNLGYVLLGQIMENVSGASYEEYVSAQILAPLGVSAADLGFVLSDGQHARGYHRRNSLNYIALRFFLDVSKYTEFGSHTWRAFRRFYVNGVAYGGMVGTADGFVRYVQALIAPKSGLLSEESRRLLFTENILDDGKASGMTLSWFKGSLNGHTYYAHAGGGGGYYTELRVYPELARGSVIVFNRSGMSDARFLDRVDRHLIAAR